MHRRAITPEIRRRESRRRKASTALTTLMVAGPASQVLAATGGGAADSRQVSGSPAAGAVDPGPGAVMFKLGSTGAAVSAVQQRLGVAADGVYGPLTERAVRAFQARSGILVDGVVGPVTWTKLFGLEQAAVSAGAARGGVAVIIRERPAAPAAEDSAREPAEGESSGAGAARPALASADGGARRTRRVAASAEGRPGAKGADRLERRRPDSPRAQPSPKRAAQRVAGPMPDAPADPAPPADPVVPESGACGPLRLSAPVKGVLTSPFGPRGGRNHDGVDIAAPAGTAVRAAECGVVSYRGVQGGYGNLVCVRHSDRLETCYAHLSGYAVGNGQAVRKGQVIGYVGCTGSCTGPHVHFETRVDGRAQDPTPYVNGGPVPGRPTVRSGGAAKAMPARSSSRSTHSTRITSASTGAEQDRASAAVAGTTHDSSLREEPPPAAQAALQQQAPASTPSQAPVAIAAPVPAPVAEQPAPVVEQPAPAPVAEEPPAPVVEQPAPVVEQPAPTPVAEAPPAPVVEQPAPAPVTEQPPAPPVAEEPPAPVVEQPAPAPVAEEPPAPSPAAPEVAPRSEVAPPVPDPAPDVPAPSTGGGAAVPTVPAPAAPPAPPMPPAPPAAASG